MCIRDSASIVVGTIQLGATVDYAILMTTRFREEQNRGHSVKESAQIAVEQCSQSILTSGLTFFVATADVYKRQPIALITKKWSILPDPPMLTLPDTCDIAEHKTRGAAAIFPDGLLLHWLQPAGSPGKFFGKTGSISARISPR